MKKFIALFLCGILTATALTGCGSSSSAGENGEVIVYNWGEYIDPETISMFEEETGIKVIYDEFENPNKFASFIMKAINNPLNSEFLKERALVFDIGYIIKQLKDSF